MSNFSKAIINPIEFIASIGLSTDHITYDPDLWKGDYSINRGATHDGTGTFTHDLLLRTVLMVALGQSYCTKHTIDFEALKGMKYTVGPIRLASVYGMVKLPISEQYKYTGERQRTRMAVRVEYIYE